MIENEVRIFFSIIRTKRRLVSELKNVYGKETAPYFNSLDFWKIDENKVSQILAYFLNPNEDHQQGDIYLKHFLEKLEIEFFNIEEKKSIKVFCEKGAGNKRRIDIAIENSFSQCIAIENKIYVWTQDQVGQIKDYIEFLKRNYSNGFCLIYLSPLEKEISDVSISNDEKEELINKAELKIISYQDHLIECISGFEMSTKNIRVKSFLQDFERKLRKMYMGEKDLTEKQTIVDYINENNRNVETAFLISNSLNEFKKELKIKFQDQIQEIGKELGLKSNGLSLFPSKWESHSIVFSYELGGILFGIKRRKQDRFKTQFPEIEELFFEKLNIKFKVSEWWPMYQFFYSNIDSDERFWLDIKNGKAKNRAKEFIELVLDNFNSNKY